MISIYSAKYKVTTAQRLLDYKLYTASTTIIMMIVEIGYNEVNKDQGWR